MKKCLKWQYCQAQTMFGQHFKVKSKKLNGGWDENEGKAYGVRERVRKWKVWNGKVGVMGLKIDELNTDWGK